MVDCTVTPRNVPTAMEISIEAVGRRRLARCQRTLRFAVPLVSPDFRAFASGLCEAPSSGKFSLCFDRTDARRSEERYTIVRYSSFTRLLAERKTKEKDEARYLRSYRSPLPIRPVDRH
ncbi:hypothetical protein V1478_010255 [Vespula squamosa]|uniref:Uncharacterized protein n=1 Tax=Vespula squamosa TaxID=30214 RepID=A0ABD2AJ90_VESSQ